MKLVLSCNIQLKLGEALGAIGDPSSLPILESFLQDSSQVIRETCELAIALIHHPKNSQETKYSSVDPAPPESLNLSINELESQLMDGSLSLFKRYRAMFALREKGGKDAVLV
jgi:deoxyhypusine monooxygenase